MPHNPLPLGKLPPDLLAALLRRLPPDPRVIVGPRPGEDAAVIDMGDYYLVAKTDPITFATDEIGWYAVQVNANDVATTGATPRFFMMSVLLPGGLADTAMAERIFTQIVEACTALEVAVVGGHTEITHSLDRPIVVGCMLGEVAKDRLVLTGGARPGDVVLLSKGVPVEATAIIAREKAGALAGAIPPDIIARCAEFLHAPGISVVEDARLATDAAGFGGVTGMHDPTEGGLATALWEVAEAAGVGIALSGAPPILPEGQRLCAALGLDPMGAIASGALLVTARPDAAPAVIRAWEQAGIAAYELGRVVAGRPRVVQADGATLPAPRATRSPGCLIHEHSVEWKVSARTLQNVT
ncbi:MAG: AIR synthase family protein [Anaerolineae bacterium]|nr:AIR synthase family protein [Anaerolineae bacterium]